MSCSTVNNSARNGGSLARVLVPFWRGIQSGQRSDSFGIVRSLSLISLQGLKPSGGHSTTRRARTILSDQTQTAFGCSQFLCTQCTKPHEVSFSPRNCRVLPLRSKQNEVAVCKNSDEGRAEFNEADNCRY